MLSLPELEKCVRQKECQPVIRLSSAQQVCLLNKGTGLSAHAVLGVMALQQVAGNLHSVALQCHLTQLTQGRIFPIHVVLCDPEVERGKTAYCRSFTEGATLWLTYMLNN